MNFEYNSVLSKAGSAAQDAYLDKKGLTAAERAVELMRFGRAAEAVDLLRTLHMSQFEIGQTIGPDAAAQFAQEQEKDESHSALFLRLANEAREAHAAVGASPMLASYAASLQADPAALAKDFAKLDAETAAQAVDRLLNSGQSAEKIAAALKSLGFSDERIKTMVAGYSDHGRSLVAAALSFDHSMAKLAAAAAERAAESKRRSFESREESKASREEDEAKAEAKAQRAEQIKIQQEAAKLSAEARESYFEMAHALSGEGSVPELAKAIDDILQPKPGNVEAIQKLKDAGRLDAVVADKMIELQKPDVIQRINKAAEAYAVNPADTKNAADAAKLVDLLDTAKARNQTKVAAAVDQDLREKYKYWLNDHQGSFDVFLADMRKLKGNANALANEQTAKAEKDAADGKITQAELANAHDQARRNDAAFQRLTTGKTIAVAEMQQIAQAAASANRKGLEEKARSQLNSFAQQYAQNVDLAQALSQDKQRSLQTLSNLVASGAISAETAEILRRQSEIMQRASQRLQAANAAAVAPAAPAQAVSPASDALQAPGAASNAAQASASDAQPPAKLAREDLPQYVAEFSAAAKMISAIQAAADAEKRPLTADETRRIAEYEKSFLRVDTLGNQEDQRRFSTLLSVVSFASSLDDAKADPKTAPSELAVLEKNYKQALESAKSLGITQSELDAAAAAYAKQKQQAALAAQGLPKQQPAAELLAAQKQHDLDLDGPPVSLQSNAAAMQKDLAAAGQSIARPAYLDDSESRRAMVANKTMSADFFRVVDESSAAADSHSGAAKEALAKSGIANPSEEQLRAMQEFARAAYLNASVAYVQKFGKFDKIMAADDALAKAEVERTVQNLKNAGIQIDESAALQAAAAAYERDLMAGAKDTTAYADVLLQSDARNVIPDTFKAALASAKPVLSAAPQAEAKPAVLGEEARAAALSSIAGKIYTSCQPGYVDLADDPHFADLKALLVKAQVNAKPTDDALATASVAEAVTGLIQHGKMTPEEYQSLASAAKADKGFTVTNDQAAAIIAWSGDPAANKSVSQSNAPAADAAAKAEQAAGAVPLQAAAVSGQKQADTAPSQTVQDQGAPAKTSAKIPQETGPAFYARLQASLPAGSELAGDLQPSKDRKSFTLLSDPRQRKFEMSMAGVAECSKTLSDKAKRDLAAAQAQFEHTSDAALSALKTAEVDAAAQNSKTAGAAEKAKFHQVHEMRERELSQAQAANIAANRVYAASARESEQMSEVASLIMHGQGAELAKRLSAPSAKPASPAAPASETLGAMPAAQPAAARKPTDFSVPRTIVATPAKAQENKPIPVVYTEATPLAAPPINKSKLKAHGGTAHAPVSGLDQSHPKFQTNFDAFRKGIAENYDAYRKDHPVNEDECNALFSDSIRQMRDILNKNPEYVAAHTQSSRLRIESETSPKPGVDYPALLKQAALDEERAKDKVFDAAGENGMAGLRAQQIMAMNLRDALGALRSGDKARAAEILLSGSRGELSEEASRGVKSAMIDVLLHQGDPEIKKLYTPGQIALLKDYFTASVAAGAITEEEMASVGKALASSATINPQTRNLLNQIKADTKANMETMAGLNTEQLGSAPAQAAKAGAIPSVEKVPEKIQQTRDAKAEDAAKAEAAGPAAPVPGA